MRRLYSHSEDVQEQMFDENSGRPVVDLVGHQGPVYGVSFGPDRRLLLSASEDSTGQCNFA